MRAEDEYVRCLARSRHSKNGGVLPVLLLVKWIEREECRLAETEDPVILCAVRGPKLVFTAPRSLMVCSQHPSP